MKVEIQKELDTMIDAVQYGSLDFTLDVHNKRIIGITTYGKKKNRYLKNNLQAVKDIASRLKYVSDNKATTKLKFSVDILNGEIKEVIWNSSMRKKFEFVPET